MGVGGNKGGGGEIVKYCLQLGLRKSGEVQWGQGRAGQGMARKGWIGLGWGGQTLICNMKPCVCYLGVVAVADSKFSDDSYSCYCNAMGGIDAQVELCFAFALVGECCHLWSYPRPRARVQLPAA